MGDRRGMVLDAALACALGLLSVALVLGVSQAGASAFLLKDATPEELVVLEEVGVAAAAAKPRPAAPPRRPSLP